MLARRRLELYPRARIRCTSAPHLRREIEDEDVDFQPVKSYDHWSQRVVEALLQGFTFRKELLVANKRKLLNSWCIVIGIPE